MIDSGEVVYARGDARLPSTADELRQKFDDCARSVSRADGDALYAAMRHLDTINDVRTLCIDKPVSTDLLATMS